MGFFRVPFPSPECGEIIPARLRSLDFDQSLSKGRDQADGIGWQADGIGWQGDAVFSPSSCPAPTAAREAGSR